jgi:hypothetical protein
MPMSLSFCKCRPPLLLLLPPLMQADAEIRRALLSLLWLHVSP